MVYLSDYLVDDKRYLFGYGGLLPNIPGVK